MENANVSKFIETITISEGEIRYHSEAYFINGPIMFEPPMFSFRIYHIVFSEENCHVAEPFYANYGRSPEACMREFLKARIWEGKTFGKPNVRCGALMAPKIPLERRAMTVKEFSVISDDRILS